MTVNGAVANLVIDEWTLSVIVLTFQGKLPNVFDKIV